MQAFAAETAHAADAAEHGQAFYDDPTFWVLIAFIILIASLSFHEAAHAWAADRLGDPTARRLGRLTLNPLAHIDWIGTVLFPLVGMLSGLPLIGWAKPVPVNFSNLRHPKKDMLWVAFAGPGANLLMACFWALIIKLAMILPITELTKPMLLMGIAGIEINLILMVLNLLPLPPLDGGRVVESLLPHSLAYQFSRVEPYGMMILLVLLFSGVLGAIVLPMINFIKLIMVSFFGLYD